MAFSQQPQTSTYTTKRLDLAPMVDGRQGQAVPSNKDVDYLNCFSEQNKEKETHWIKRAGTTDYLTLPSSNVRGVYYWEDLSRVYVATDNDVTIYNSNTGAVITTLNNIFGTVVGEVGFTEFLYDTNTTKIVITDGTTLGTVDALDVWAAGADPDMPVPHLPQPIFLDGYLFIVKANTADIYNSNLNDPLAYTAGDFISCEMFPDVILKFAKLNNYLVAFGSASIEYFWDAANPTGSPLQRNDTPVKLIGYLGGFAQSANRIYFVGNSSTSTPEVFMLEDFKIESVSNETVRRYLEVQLNTLISSVGNIISCYGHDFYVINIGVLTYVMDLKSKAWARWSFQNNNDFALKESISVKTNVTYASVVFMNGMMKMLKMSPFAVMDDNVNFPVRIVTDKHDFESYNRKSCARLSVFADRASAYPNALLSVSWSDDDYQTFSTPRTIALDSDLPSLHRLGMFRWRAFKFEFTQPALFRMLAVEVDLNLGLS